METKCIQPTTKNMFKKKRANNSTVAISNSMKWTKTNENKEHFGWDYFSGIDLLMYKIFALSLSFSVTLEPFGIACFLSLSFTLFSALSQTNGIIIGRQTLFAKHKCKYPCSQMSCSHIFIPLQSTIREPSIFQYYSDIKATAKGIQSNTAKQTHRP